MHDICRELQDILELCRAAAETRKPEAATALREAIEKIEEARKLLLPRPPGLRLVDPLPGGDLQLRSGPNRKAAVRTPLPSRTHTF